MEMWKDLDLEEMEREENAWAGPRPPEEVEQIVVMVRLELYNRSLPCGPKALRRRLKEHYALKPLPSERTIARILARTGLTYGRTGWYEGDDPEWLPASAKRWRPQKTGV
jgi:hypothetical protein